MQWIPNSWIGLWTVALGVSIAAPVLGADGDNLWDVDGEEIGSGGFHVVASDEAGGAFVAWEGAGIFVQLVDDGGTTQWTSPTQLTTSATASLPAIYAEWPWGATVVWQDTGGIYAQRVDYSGTPMWTPNPGGVQVATSGEVPLVVHYPGAGLGDPPGAFVAWGELVRIASVDGSGNVTAPGVDGIYLGDGVRLPGYMRMITDGAGGAFVIWANYAKHIVAQRINAGLPWGPTPTVISNDFRDEGPLDAAPDGSGGALISWSATWPLPAAGQIRVQHINSSGAGSWGTNGRVVVDSSVVGGDGNAWYGFTLTSSIDTDGAGGAIVAWSDWRNEPPGTTNPGNDDIYAQRVDASGASLWTTNGVLLPPFIMGSTAPGSQRLPELVSDRNGGAVVTYQDLGGNSWDISATRLDAYGTKLFSRYVFTDFNGDDEDQTQPLIVFDGSGPSPAGAVIAWDDDRSGLDVRAQKVEISGPANDDASAATATTAGTYSGTILGAGKDGESICGDGGEADVWYVFTPPGPGTLEVDTCGTHDLGGVDAGMDSVVSLHSAAPGTQGNQLACNDDWQNGMPADQCAGSDTATLRDSATAVAVTTTDPVWIRVSHYPQTPPGDFEINVRFVPEPGHLAMLTAGTLALALLRRGRRCDPDVRPRCSARRCFGAERPSSRRSAPPVISLKSSRARRPRGPDVRGRPCLRGALRRPGMRPRTIRRVRLAGSRARFESRPAPRPAAENGRDGSHSDNRMRRSGRAESGPKAERGCAPPSRAPTEQGPSSRMHPAAACVLARSRYASAASWLCARDVRYAPGGRRDRTRCPRRRRGPEVRRVGRARRRESASYSRQRAPAHRSPRASGESSRPGPRGEPARLCHSVS